MANANGASSPGNNGHFSLQYTLSHSTPSRGVSHAIHPPPPAAALHEGNDAGVATKAKPLCHAFDARTHLLYHPRRENVRRWRCKVHTRAPLKFFFDREDDALSHGNARGQGFEDIRTF